MEIAVIIALLLLVGFGLWFVLKNNKPDQETRDIENGWVDDSSTIIDVSVVKDVPATMVETLTKADPQPTVVEPVAKPARKPRQPRVKNPPDPIPSPDPVKAVKKPRQRAAKKTAQINAQARKDAQ